MARVVCDPDRVPLVFIPDDAQYGPQDLLLCDRHFILHIHEHRGLHEEPPLESLRMPLAAGKNLRAFGDASADICLDSFQLLLCDHRPDRRSRIGRLSHPKRRKCGENCPLHCIE